MSMLRTLFDNSDAGPWGHYDQLEETGLVHSVPLFGPRHEMSLECWCHPELAGQLVQHWSQQ